MLNAMAAVPAARAIAPARSRRLAGVEELPHTVERAHDVLGGVGVGQAEIALAENAEIRTADDRDAGILQQRRRERLRLPPGGADIGERVEGALRRRA